MTSQSPDISWEELDGQEPDHQIGLSPDRRYSCRVLFEYGTTTAAIYETATRRIVKRPDQLAATNWIDGGEVLALVDHPSGNGRGVAERRTWPDWELIASTPFPIAPFVTHLATSSHGVAAVAWTDPDTESGVTVLTCSRAGLNVRIGFTSRSGIAHAVTVGPGGRLVAAIFDETHWRADGGFVVALDVQSGGIQQWPLDPETEFEEDPQFENEFCFTVQHQDGSILTFNGAPMYGLGDHPSHLS